MSSKGKEFTSNPDRSSHFDLCLYCLNCSKCVDEHWKICRMRLDRASVKKLMKTKSSSYFTKIHSK